VQYVVVHAARLEGAERGVVEAALANPLCRLAAQAGDDYLFELLSAARSPLTVLRFDTSGSLSMSCTSGATFVPHSSMLFSRRRAACRSHFRSKRQAEILHGCTIFSATV
jgi:hypothetical protein